MEDACLAAAQCALDALTATSCGLQPVALSRVKVFLPDSAPCNITATGAALCVCARARGVVCVSHTLTLSLAVWGCAAFSKAWSTTVGGGGSAKHAPSVSVVPVTAVWGGKGGWGNL